MSIYEEVNRARQRAVPLMAVETSDQLAFLRKLAESSRVPILVNDVVRGLWSVNGAEVQLSYFDVSGEEGAEKYQGAAGCVLALKALLECEDISQCFLAVLNAHYAVSESAVSQALCLLRDVLKARKGQSIPSVLLLAPSLSLPAELQQDVLTFEDANPSRQELLSLVNGVVSATARKAPKVAEVITQQRQEELANALVGLAQFPAEQAIKLAFPSLAQLEQGEGFNIRSVQGQKRKFVQQAKGVTLETPSARFEDLAGLENGKGFLRALMNGPDSPIAVLFIDEIDKAMEGSTGGDLSGVSSGFLGALLSFTTDWETMGLLLYGIPGTGKTALARALCGEYNLPLLNADLGAMRGSLVGESENNLRAALRVAKAVSEKRRLLVIATCNRVGSLATELEARFNLGSFFFDFPSPDAIGQAWGIWQRNFQLPEQETPLAEKWVGRDVRDACEKAYRLNLSILEASRYTVPACVRDKERLQALRQAASGRFLDIDKPGVFTLADAPVSTKPDEGVNLDLATPSTQVVGGGQGGRPNMVVFMPGLGGGQQEEPPAKERIGF